MTAPSDGHPRRIIRGVATAIAVLAGGWLVALLFTGGFATAILGQTITSHEPRIPLLICTLAITLFILADGRIQPRRLAAAFVARVAGVTPASWAGGIAAATFVVGLTFATTAASGADAYGYVSQADLWLRGDLKTEQPWVAEMPWPSRRWAFSPLGYRPVPGDPLATIVPTYSPGLPLLMAAAKLIGGQPAMFWVPPFFGALGVLATFGIGRRLGAPGAGAIAAALVAASPAYLFMLMTPMSDVTVAGAWAVSFYFLLGSSPRSIVAAGLMAAVALLVRPNLFFVPAVFALWYLIRREAGDAGAWLARFKRAALFSLAVAPAVIVVALFNWQMYGSPATSGYGRLSDQFAAMNLLPNIRNYFWWFVETQTPVAVIGLAAIVVPLRRIWPAVPDRRVFAIIALFVGGIVLQFMAYLVFDVWWYLRFLLPCWPFIMLGVAGAVVAVARLSRAGAIAAGIVVTGVCTYGVLIAADRSAFHMWQGERRYVSVARLVRDRTDRYSAVITQMHSGSLRYYGGRMTIRFDNIDPGWLDRSVANLTARGVHVYLLLEDWELPEFRERFAGERAIEHLDFPTLVYRGPARILFYDLSALPTPPVAPETFVETFADRQRSVPPAPAPRLVLK